MRLDRPAQQDRRDTVSDHTPQPLGEAIGPTENIGSSTGQAIGARTLAELDPPTDTAGELDRAEIQAQRAEADAEGEAALAEAERKTPPFLRETRIEGSLTAAIDLVLDSWAGSAERVAKVIAAHTDDEGYVATKPEVMTAIEGFDFKGLGGALRAVQQQLAEATTDSLWCENLRKNEVERQIVERLVRDALRLAFSVSVNDGEDTTLHESTDLDAIGKAMGTTDEDWLVFHSPARGRVGWVRLIYGNGADVISDYTANETMERIVAGANALAARFNGDA